MKGRVAVVGAALAITAATGLSVTAAPDPQPITAHAFTIAAEAYPAAPVPGRGQTELGTRPMGTRLSISNAPATAYARSALSDNGTIELYTGPPPPGSVAECDTSSPNIPDAAEATPAGSKLTADCTPAPTGRATAVGTFDDASTTGSGSGSSNVSGDGSGSAVLATATAAVSDFRIGPIHFGSAHYNASATTDGTPSGAKGSGHVDVSDASVADVPVTIGPDGVAVDQTKVPVELVDAATKSVHDALNQGGYLDVRVVQPDVTIAPDGASVQVRGGGVFFEGSTNDPTQPYFLRDTLVGGSLTVAVGGALSGDAGDDAVTETPAPTATEVTTPAPSTRTETAAAPETPQASSPSLLAHRTVRHTSSPRLVWLWVMLLLLVASLVATVFRKQLLPRWDAFANRYLRG